MKNLFIILLFIPALTMAGGLHGSYTIGGASPDFHTFRAAVKALRDSGVSAAVVFNVRDGHYVESVTLDSINGISRTNTVTFQGQSGNPAKVLLDTNFHKLGYASGTTCLIKSSFTKFQYMTVNNHDSLGDAMELWDSDEVYNCIFPHSGIFLWWGSHLSYSYLHCGLDMENGEVDHNYFDSGAYISFDENNYGYLSLIHDNDFEFLSTSWNNPAISFINSYSLSGWLTLKAYNNIIHIIGNGVAFQFYGAAYGDIKIYNNFIYGDTGTGIYIDGPAENIGIYNNSIYFKRKGFFNCAVAIFVDSFNFYYNSSYSPQPSHDTIENNIFDVGNLDPIAEYGDTLIKWDYNDYYYSFSLSARRARGLDSHSIVHKPIFDAWNNLHTVDKALKGKATPISFITTDIDGDKRDPLHPDIGADEFSFMRNDDIGVSILYLPHDSTCGRDSNAIGLRLRNYGINNEKNFSVKLSVTGGATDSLNYSFRDSIQRGKDTLLYVSFSPALNTLKGGNFSFTAYTLLSADTSHRNDTAKAASFIYSAPLANISGNPLTCSNSSALYSAVSAPGISYTWAAGGGSISKGSGTDSITTSWRKASGSVKLLETNSSGCKDSTMLMVTVDTTCVWPGDANDDKVVDGKDILAIGLGYGKTGPRRLSASTGWYGQPCADWKDTLSYGVNDKQADCNGDSTVNYSDTLAVKANYSKTHLKTFAFTQGKPSDPPLYFIFTRDSAQGGDIVQADIMYGTAATPATKVYGLTFSVLYDASLVDTVLARFSSGWLAAQPVSLGIMPSAGEIDLATVRTNHLDTTGSGKLASLYFKIKSKLPAQRNKLLLQLGNNTQLNAASQYRPVYMLSDSIAVMQTFTGIYTSAFSKTAISLYPNPVKDILYIKGLGERGLISLRDVEGKTVYPPLTVSESCNLNLSSLSPGIYILQYTSPKNTYIQKIIKQ